jgi:hypothetical protein
MKIEALTEHIKRAVRPHSIASRLSPKNSRGCRLAAPAARHSLLASKLFLQPRQPIAMPGAHALVTQLRNEKSQFFQSEAELLCKRSFAQCPERTLIFV